MKKLWVSMFLVCLLGICTIGMAGCSGKEQQPDSKTKYTYEDLKALEGDELLKVFKENGLTIQDELLEILPEEKVAALLKEDFDLLIEGSTTRDHTAYHDFAEDVQKVYSKIAEKK